jgi:hypothetical protein
MADLAALLVRRDKIIDDLATATALKQSADRAADQAAQQAQFATSSGAKSSFESSANRARGESRRQAATITRLNRELAEVNVQIAALQRQQAAPRQSAAQTVREDQAARAEGASATNPPPPPLVIEIDGVARPQENDEVTNAQQTPISGRPGAAQDRGLNDPVRRAQSTQATPATLPEPGPVVPNPRGPQPASTIGAAAAGDDVRASINAIFAGENAKIVTQDNALDKYASYTYSISIYLMSPEDYARLVRNKVKNLAGYNLLIQSAGIPISTGFGSTPGFVGGDTGEVPGVTTRSLDAGRNEYFQEDFYIDDLRLKSVISGKGTGGPHNVTSLDFRIIEPNGITLLPRLYKATQAYVASEGGVEAQNYAAQNFLMVIRFYGYDPDGNQYLPIKGSRNDVEGNPVTTPQAIEKFIPFQFTNIKFRVADRLTEYTCEAVCPQNLVNTGPARGAIPYNVEITSKTLQELLNGPVAFSSPSRTGAVTDQSEAETQRLQRQANLGGPSSTTDQSAIETARPTTTNTAPPNASAISTPTITQGLAQALNKYQEDLVKKGTYTIPDTYRIEIVTPALQNARVVPPGQTNQRKVPMGASGKAPANQQKNPAAQSQNKDAGTTSALAGMSIMQFIDQYTRTSTYIYDQQTKILDPKTGRVRPNGTPAEVTAWYRVGLQATPREYDPKRNDHAYDIVYQLSPYKVNDVQSDYFPQGEFQGTHKKYNYWFTGQNTQILKFEQDFNYLYYLTVNTDQPTVATGVTSDYREKLKKSFSPRSAQSSMGQEGATNEASANAADYLYSPADQARIKLEILGDPAWIQQGELWAGIAGAGQFYGPFLEDGTINYEGQEVLFEVAFNQPVDYNLDTGIMDPTTKNFNRTDSNAGDARQSYIYRAVDVTSTFSQGRFTQELNGVLLLFELPDTKTAQPLQAQPSISAPAARRGSTNTARIQPQPQGALSAAPEVDFVGSEFGAYFGSGETGGAVNYKPTGLAQVLDRQQQQGPGIGTQGVAPAPATTPPGQTPPTSSGQPVGPAASGTSAVNRLGGASGPAVGQPVTVPVILNSAGVINVTSNEEIQALFSQGFISAQTRNKAESQLAAKRQAANSPVTSQPTQRIAREP